jgi:uncharacterized protein YutE (UPF0331/DUF86 family)
MVDVAALRNRLNALEEYVARPESKRHVSYEQMLADWVTYYAIQRIFQMASQAAIDIAGHILSADFTRRVDDYYAAILALGSEKVLPEEFAQHFADVARFRNVLVHEYLVVDPAKVYQFLQTGLDDFRAYIEYVSEYLRKTGTV